ncbi:hypothetical protein QVD17_31604 [Tagetes erecta]|uniref:Uncharacterized protein n=1 Tax=Tagetes erecta TaxID=13708 RepID=A0AAD8NPD7_TARER|nr:hypothetical protein QVD17_31604 [Tagetes erecta]
MTLKKIYPPSRLLPIHQIKNKRDPIPISKSSLKSLEPSTSAATCTTAGHFPITSPTKITKLSSQWTQASRFHSLFPLFFIIFFDF